MKRGFIRGLWGIQHGVGRRGRWDPIKRDKLDNDIALSKINKFEVDFTAYVFGEDNYKILVDDGFKCKLLDKRPIVWDLKSQHYRHKLEVLKQGAEDFDEVILLDWDTIAIKPVDDLFWNNLSKKYPIQAVLRRYRKNVRAFWRERDHALIPCASFVYLRDKNLAYDMIKFWETLKWQWSEEVPMAKIMDDLTGGWKGAENYWNCFEPDSFRLLRAIVFSKSRIANKNIYFEHYWSDTVKYIVEKTEICKNKPQFNWIK